MVSVKVMPFFILVTRICQPVKDMYAIIYIIFVGIFWTAIHTVVVGVLPTEIALVSFDLLQIFLIYQSLQPFKHLNIIK
jgi:hypothetical protein